MIRPPLGERLVQVDGARALDTTLNIVPVQTGGVNVHAADECHELVPVLDDGELLVVGAEVEVPVVVDGATVLQPIDAQNLGLVVGALTAKQIRVQHGAHGDSAPITGLDQELFQRLASQRCVEPELPSHDEDEVAGACRLAYRVPERRVVVGSLD
ncbi:MAG: hypothetical protein WKG00_18320 [Polyangiaceae bacterium]